MRVSQFVCVVLVVLGFAVTGFSAGGEVGNGGDVITCVASAENSFSGKYSLDFILTSGANELASVSSHTASLARIENIFYNNLPEYYESFRSYVSLINNRDFSKNRIWESAPYGLIDLKDESIVSLVPSNCTRNGKIEVVQAVIRMNPLFSGTPADTIIYKFVPAIFDELKDDRPLQLSFLLVHEWLWEVSKNVERNRRINHFLHSKFIEGLSQKSLRSQIKGLGLSLGQAFSPLYYEQSCEPESLGIGAFLEGLDGQKFEFKTVYDVRSRQCGDGENCELKWSSASAFFDMANLSTRIQKNAVGDLSGEFALTIEAENRKSMVLNCRISKPSATILCRSFTSSFENGFTVSRPFKNFSGALGSNCLRLVANSSQESKGKTTDYQNLIYLYLK